MLVKFVEIDFLLFIYESWKSKIFNAIFYAICITIKYQRDPFFFFKILTLTYWILNKPIRKVNTNLWESEIFVFDINYFNLISLFISLFYIYCTIIKFSNEI